MKYINKIINIGGEDYAIAITVSTKPIAIYVNKVNNSSFGAYVYTINGPKGVYLTLLQNSENYEMVQSLNSLLVTKYQRPIYLNISGDVSNNELLRALVTEINLIL